MSGVNRRAWMAAVTAGGGAFGLPSALAAPPTADTIMPNTPKDLKITGLRVTPIALPDPPILAAGGCHGPYFLRNIIEVETDAGVTGIGETHGGEGVTAGLEKCREHVVGQSVFAYRKFAAKLKSISNSPLRRR